MLSNNRSPRRKPSWKSIGRKKRRVTKRTSLSPRSVLARNRKNSLSKILGLDSPTRNGGTGTKSIIRKNNRPVSKYSKYALIPTSTEPFEKACTYDIVSEYVDAVQI